MRSSQEATGFAPIFHRRKWVTYYQHQRKFGEGGTTLLWNAAFGIMVVWIAIEQGLHHKQIRQAAYSKRKAAIQAEESKCWEEERALMAVDKKELTESQFRVDSGEVSPAAVADAALVPLPIDALKDFAPKGGRQ